MKLNISYPATGCQKVIEVDEEKKLRAFYDKRMSQEVEGDILGDDFKGYIFRISGGNDKEGFAMKQGILTSQRVRILFSKGHSCFRERRSGERKRKSVRGCIVSAALSVLNLVIVKKGDNDIPGLTDTVKPRRLGPKRASRIRKLFNLTKEDDVRKYVIRREIKKDGKKTKTKAPKIQRLITPQRLQHKRQIEGEKRRRWQKSQQEAREYNEMLAKYLREQREHRALVKKRSVSRRESSKGEEVKKDTKKAAAPAKDTKPKATKDAKPAATAAPAKPAAAPAKPAAKESKPAAAAPAKESKQKPAESKPAEQKPKDKKPAAAPKEQPKAEAKGKGGKKQ